MASRRVRIKGIANIPQRRKTDIPNTLPVVQGNSPVQAKEAENETSKPVIESVTTQNSTSKLISGQSNTTQLEIEANNNDFNQATDHVKSGLTASELDANTCNTFVKPISTLTSIKPKKTTSANDVSAIRPASPVSDSSQKTLIQSSADAPALRMVSRSRIKAVPNLEGRRVSIHGRESESEDESRKQHVSRVRNDSTCTVASTTAIDIDSNVTASRAKQYNSLIQRKCRRSEQSRKMAEARREFHKKFSNGKPLDKSRLTMMDLIFYNPLSNPMSKKKLSQATIAGKNRSLKSEISSDDTAKNNDKNCKPIIDTSLTDSNISNFLTPSSNLLQDFEEAIDNDVQEISQNDGQKTQEDEEEEREEEPSLVPQIKVGPDGNVVIDEQSLVINQTSAKDRNVLDESPIVDGNSESSYGVYKKAKRNKDWTPAETLRFYRALNTIGTDFSIMNRLFPKRSRKELKMKFKKEERLNHELVDKALKKPVTYDTTDLIKEMEEEEAKLAALEEEKAKQKEGKKLNGGSKRKRNCPFLPPNIKEMQVSSSNEKELAKIPKIHTREMNKENEGSEDRESIILSSSDEDDDDPNEMVILRPTRSGRIPIPRLKDLPTDVDLSMRKLMSFKPPTPLRKKSESPVPMSDDEDPSPMTSPSAMPNLLPQGMTRIQPGSLVVVKTDNENGIPSFNVFMVTQGQQQMHLAMSNENLKNLTNHLGQATHLDYKNTVPNENIQRNPTVVAMSLGDKPALAENNYTIVETPPDVTESNRTSVESNLQFREEMHPQHPLNEHNYMAPEPPIYQFTSDFIHAPASCIP